MKRAPPLWQRALERRRLEELDVALRHRAPTQRGRPKRIHPRAQVGDRFADLEVVALVPPDRTANERVTVRCPHGVEWTAYVFNLRKRRLGARCRHPARVVAEDLDDEVAQ